MRDIKTLTKEEFIQRTNSGETQREIAALFGVVYQAIQYRKRKWKIPNLKNWTAKGKDHPNWRGGISIEKRTGYKRVSSPGRGKCGNYTYEHVLIMEKHLGRMLNKNEHVHHIDGDKTNNNIPNLVALTASEHRKVHRSLEIIAMELYKDGKIIFENGGYKWAK